MCMNPHSCPHLADLFDFPAGDGVVIYSFHPHIGPLYWACDVRARQAGDLAQALTTRPAAASTYCPGGATVPSVFERWRAGGASAGEFSAGSLRELAEHHGCSLAELRAWSDTTVWIERPSPPAGAQRSGLREFVHGGRQQAARPAHARPNHALEADAAWSMCRLVRQFAMGPAGQRRLAMDLERKSFLNAALAGERYIADGGRGAVSGHVDQFPLLRDAFDIGVSIALYTMSVRAGAALVAA
jgi:hypothetical protein